MILASLPPARGMILVKMQVLLAEGGATVPHLTARLQRPDVVETLAGNRVQGLSKLAAVLLNPDPCGLPDTRVRERRRRPNGCHVYNVLHS